MKLGKVPMKAGGSGKRNAIIEQGKQVSTTTQRAATTARHCHTEKTQWRYLPTCILITASQDGGKGRCKLPHKCTIRSSKMHDLQSEYASSNSKRRPVCLHFSSFLTGVLIFPSRNSTYH